MLRMKTRRIKLWEDRSIDLLHKMLLFSDLPYLFQIHKFISIVQPNLNIHSRYINLIKGNRNEKKRRETCVADVPSRGTNILQGWLFVKRELFILCPSVYLLSGQICMKIPHNTIETAPFIRPFIIVTSHH